MGEKTMAGCLKREIASVDQSLDVHRKAWNPENNGELRCKLLFDEFLEGFLKEISSISCYRPLPPLIGQGQEIDLFKLYSVVRNRGGCCSVSNKRSWGLVAVDCGLDSGIGAALKLVYFKYLDTLDRFLRKIVKDRDNEKVEFSTLLKDLDLGLKLLLPGGLDKGLVEFKKSVIVSGDEDMENKNNKGCAESVGEKQCDEKGGNAGDPGMDDGASRKRKRNSCFQMLNWIRAVAKDPSSPAVEELPEKAKWKSYGSDVPWKQILWARETLLLKRSDASSQQLVWQKKQKMHPSMYDDDRCTSGRMRCSQRLILAKDTFRKATERPRPESSSSSSQSEDDVSEMQADPSADSSGFWKKCHRQKRVSIGQQFQAELPAFSGAEYESHLKWLGTKTWPLEKGEYTIRLIERDPIGKGRQESCGCQFPGSPDCVKFHVHEKRMKIKLELGPAFYKWKFDGMGEDVALSWTKADENKFQNIVETNRLSSEKYFWDELFKFFPQKGREALVSYYFNIFLLRRRAEQNRSSTSKADSDDEEAEYGPVANKFGQTTSKSIFCSPKKSHSSNR